VDVTLQLNIVAAAGAATRLGRSDRRPTRQHISTIRDTSAAIYYSGIPALGRGPDTDWFSFVENCDPDFAPTIGTGTVEIWVKLKP